ncbi:LPXTG cell wall anchor domain-containing protein, partial [Enterococcus faecalis]|nr:LPXTG cell wall anchor domain-containing protein [Enterococcus faecalis]
DGVDPESLKAQSDLVDQEASKAIEAINMAPTKGTVTEAKVKGKFKGEEAIKELPSTGQMSYSFFVEMGILSVLSSIFGLLGFIKKRNEVE